MAQSGGTAGVRRLRTAAPAAPLLALLALALLLSGCGDDGGSDEGAGGSEAADRGDDAGTEAPGLVDGPATVSAIDNTFRPEEIAVTVGSEITFSNDGRNQHNVLPAEGDAWGVEASAFEPGDTYTVSFDEPGTYRYYCSIHGTADAGMIGTIEVG